MSLGTRIADLRKHSRMSQMQLATILGVSQSTLGMYETDKRTPSPRVLKKISNYFHVSVDYLLDNTTNKVSASKIDLEKNPVVLSYGGYPASPEDMEIIKAILKRHQDKNKKDDKDKGQDK